MSNVSKAKSVAAGIDYPLSLDETEDDQGKVISVLNNDGKVLCDAYDASMAGKIRDSLDICAAIAHESIDIASLVKTLSTDYSVSAQEIATDIARMLEIMRIVDADNIVKEDLQKIVSMFAARARYMQDELSYDSDNLKKLFRALTVVSKNRQPGGVRGLARHHRSQFSSWKDDAALWRSRIIGE